MSHLDDFLADLEDGRLHPGHLAAVLREIRAGMEELTAAVAAQAPAEVPAETPDETPADAPDETPAEPTPAPRTRSKRS